MSDTDWCGNFGCGKCYDCKCHQIGILLSRSESLERQLEEAREVIKGIDRYIEAECQEAWSNNWEGREGAFVDIAKKLKKLKEQG